MFNTHNWSRKMNVSFECSFQDSRKCEASNILSSRDLGPLLNSLRFIYCSTIIFNEKRKFPVKVLNYFWHNSASCNCEYLSLFSVYSLHICGGGQWWVVRVSGLETVPARYARLADTDQNIPKHTRSR